MPNIIQYHTVSRILLNDSFKQSTPKSGETAYLVEPKSRAIFAGYYSKVPKCLLPSLKGNDTLEIFVATHVARGYLQEGSTPTTPLTWEPNETVVSLAGNGFADSPGLGSYHITTLKALTGTQRKPVDEWQQPDAVKTATSTTALLEALVPILENYEISAVYHDMHNAAGRSSYWLEIWSQYGKLLSFNRQSNDPNVRAQMIELTALYQESQKNRSDNYEPFRMKVQEVHDQHQSKFPSEGKSFATVMQETYNNVYNWGATLFAKPVQSRPEYREEFVIRPPERTAGQ